MNNDGKRKEGTEKEEPKKGCKENKRYNRRRGVRERDESSKVVQLGKV